MVARYIFFSIFSPFFRTQFSVFTARNSTKFCHTFRAESDLKMVAQNLGFLLLKYGAPKLFIFDGFATTSQLDISSE